ncbi:MAG TPA: NAD(P)/FAD-dependent oxidoreductase, partial [Sphingomicrobium sp.]|nr:NAD(P)/FAD-dependent oxidoreductase [Sphingomicrobium sp.]
EADLCSNEEVALVGGGNSAGQATVFLASRARKVTLIARRPLDETMSQYLLERIEAQPNIDVVIGCEISELKGREGELEGVSWRNRQTGKVESRPVRYLFSFIGAEPNTDWLSASGIRLDPRGFVLTGDDAGAGNLPLETCRKGIFAVGDVRSGSVKRVAASVGDGAAVVASIHAYLAKQQELAPRFVMTNMPAALV